MKRKLHLPFFLILPIFGAAASPLVAEVIAASASGFVKIDSIQNTDLPFSIPLDRGPTYSGSAASVNGNVISVSGTPFEENELMYAQGTQTNSYFLLIRDGILKGRTYDILSNTTNSITVEPDHPTNDLATQGLQADTAISVMPYWTLITLLPSGSGFPVSDDPFNPTALILVRDPNVPGIRRAPSRAYFYYEGNANENGWYNADDLADGLKNDTPLPRETFYVLRNLGDSDTTLTIQGDVPNVPFTTQIGNLAENQPQDSYVGSPFPVQMSLTESELVESSAFKTSNDPFSPKDLLLTYDYANLSGLRPAPSKAYFYLKDAVLGDNGWYDANTLSGPLDSLDIFIPGGAYIIRSAAGAVGTITWIAPPPYPVNN